MPYEIIRRQSTFWDLRRDDQVVERVRFIGKEEFGFSEGMVPSFEILDAHPLLMEYQAPWAMVYAAQPVSAPEKVARELKDAIEEGVAPWRSPSRYLNSVGVEQLLGAGHGQILDAPSPIVDVCVAVLEAARVPFARLAGRPARSSPKAFIAGLNYVVANNFSVERVA